MGVDPLTLGLSIGIPAAALIIGYGMYYNSPDQKNVRYHKKWPADTDPGKLSKRDREQYEKDDENYMNGNSTWFNKGGSKKRRSFGAIRRIKRSNRRR